MTNKNIKAAFLAILLSTGAGLTHAQAPTIDRGYYVGGALGQSEAKEYDCTAATLHCENRGTVGRVFGGYQFARHWAAELGFVDLGTVDSASAGFDESIKVRLVELSVLASYPATAKFMIYGRAGGYYAQTTHDVTNAGVFSRQSEQNGGIVWGGGLQYFIAGGFALRGEAARYMKVGGGNIGDSDYNAYTIGALWKF